MKEKDEGILDDFYFIEKGIWIPCIYDWNQFGCLCKPFIEKSNVKAVRSLTKSFLRFGLGKSDANEEPKIFFEFVTRRDFENKTPEEMRVLFRQAWEKEKKWQERRKREIRQKAEVRRPPIVVERETPTQRDIQISTEEDKFVKIPKAIQEARFNSKDKLFPTKGNEIFKFENNEVIKDIPDTFPFSFDMEMVLLGFFNLLSSSGFNNSLVDRGHGYFPGSRGKNIFFIPIRRQRDLFDAIGMRERKPGVFVNEQKVKKAFEDLMTYQHPVLHKRDTGETTEDEKAIIECIISFEPLFRLFQYERIVDESSFRRAVLERNPNGGWRFRGTVKNSIIMLNPTFWPEEIVRKSRKLESSLYKKIEESRMRLSNAEGKRYWKKEQVFISFVYYLLRQGGRYKKNQQGEIFYEIEREIEGLIRKLGLLERYKHNEKNAFLVLERALEIYKDIGYIHSYECMESKRGSNIKLRIRLNLEKFPHLQQPASRFLLSQ